MKSIEVVDNAVKRAKLAFIKWSNLSTEKRKTYLTKFKNKLKEKRDSFAEIISLETGKPLWESKMEVDSMITKIDISFKAQSIRCNDFSTVMKGARSQTVHKAIGVLAVLGPFNFPAHLPNGHIIPALLAGNTVVFKPSKLTPRVGREYYKIWQSVKLPTGVINLVLSAPKIGEYLSKHTHIDGLLFTGSYETGKKLSEHFGYHPEKLLALEMGGNNPLVIGSIKDIDKAVDITIQSAYLSAGQRCTCARRLIVQRGNMGDQFLKKLAEKIKTIKVGHYKDKPEPFMGPVINEQAANKLLEAQKKLIKLGAKPLLKMEKLNASLLTPGLIDVTMIKKREDVEIFGPLLQIIRVKKFDEALKEANNTKYGLAASIVTDKEKEWLAFFRSVKCGVINWNMPTNGALGINPFGGVGISGNFRPSALYAADYCSYPVASLQKRSKSK